MAWPRFLLFIGAAFWGLGCGGDKSTNTSPNRPPAVPVLLSPSDSVTLPVGTIALTWRCSDPDGDKLVYDVYFGRQSPLPIAARGVADTTLAIGALAEGYYLWYVIARDEHGATTPSSTYRFSVAAQQRAVPSAPSPGDDATAQSIFGTILHWEYSDLRGGSDGTTFDIYLGTDTVPPLVSSNDHFQSTYNLLIYPTYGQTLTLESDKTYYWQIAAVNSPQERAVGPVWHFHTPQELPLVARINTPYYYGDLHVEGGLAYFRARGGLGILDLSQPTAMPLMGLFPHGGLGGIAVEGNYAFALYNENCTKIESLLVVDVTIPANPHRVGALKTLGEGRGIVVDRNYVYVVSRPIDRIVSVPPPGLCSYFMNDSLYVEVIDITAPSRPARVGVLAMTGHDYRDNYFEDPTKIVVSGGLLYLSFRDEFLGIVDVSVPARPALISMMTGIVDESHPAFDVDGKYFFSESGIWNVSGPGNLQLLGRFPGLNSGFDPKGVIVEGEYVYLFGRTGVKVYRVVDPVSPELVGECRFQGGSGRRMAVKDGYVYISFLTGGNGYPGTEYGVLVLKRKSASM